MPARRSSGIASPRIRPLGSAITSFSLLCNRNLPLGPPRGRATPYTATRGDGSRRAGSAEVERVAGAPRRRPRLAEILHTAEDLPGFEAQAGAAREIEDDGGAVMMDRQDLQQPVGITAVEATQPDGADIREGEAGERALVMCRVDRLRLPAEAIGDEDEAALLREILHVADRDEGILEDRRNDGEILLVDRPQLQPVGHRATSGAVAQPLDLGTAGGELLLDALVAPVEVVDAV